MLSSLHSLLSLIKGVSHTKEVLPAFFIMKEAGGSFCFKCQSGISYLALVKSHELDKNKTHKKKYIF